MDKFVNKIYREKLRLTYTGIGSLPFKDKNAPNESINYVFDYCDNFPYWAQLPHFKKEENIAYQFTENFLGLHYDDRKCRFYFDDTKGNFKEGLRELSDNYNEVISASSLYEVENILDKYKITSPYSNTINIFLKTLKNMENKPDFVKGTITGPFTFLTSFCDAAGKPVIFNEAIKEITVKTLTLKALWQIKEFRKSSLKSTPVIFIDEPGISKTSSYYNSVDKKEEIFSMLKIISDNIKKFDALSGIHCCGKTDWGSIIDTGTDIINFDAYFYSENVQNYSEKLKIFLQNGGFLALGIVPTIDLEALSSLNINILYKKFEEAINILSKDIDKNLIIEQCFITPGCGCGSLSIDLAKKASILTKELSQTLKKEIRINI